MGGQRSSVLIVLLGALSACSPAAPGSSTAGALAAPAAGPASRAPAAPAQGHGASLFDGNCAACHQQSGRGIPGVYPSLAGSPVVLGDPKALALWVIEGRRPATMPPGRYPTVMPHFGWLGEADAAALFTYLRSSFGNHAPPVDAATLAGALEGGR